VVGLTILTILAVRRFRPHWPAFLVAVALASAAAWLLGLPAETIGSRFGGVPRALPLPALPEFSLDKDRAVLPDAAAFALLGATESLLSAVVADGMTGRRHRSNCELVAQGAANIGSALFGGMVVTGIIARTATNVRSGARGPVAGILHAAFLLLFMLLAAPLLAFIPLAALAGVLVVVAWNMVERHAAAALLRSSRGDALVLGATFLLTVFRDLTEAIVVGSAVGALIVLRRMAQAISIETHTPLVAGDRADAEDGGRTPYDAGLSADPDVMVYRISGAFFFGAASSIGAVLDRLAEQPRSFVLDMAAVPFLDSTAANTIEGFSRKLARNGVKLVVTGASRSVRHVLVRHGVRPPHVRFTPSIEEALLRLRRAETPSAPRQDAA
jgi:sulfate permease, SulP family